MPPNKINSNSLKTSTNFYFEMSNFSTKIGPRFPRSPFTWILQLLIFLNIEKNPRASEVNCRCDIGLLSTTLGTEPMPTSVSSLVLYIS